MATHDYVIANGTGAAVRSDLNNALAAIVSNNSSSSEPGTTYAYQWWADTNANVLKIRNSANDGWITLRELDGTMLIEDGSASTPGLAFADDVNTGIFSPAADQIGFATGGAERLEIGSSEVVFNDPANNVDFRVESEGNTHMLFVNAGNSRVGIGETDPEVKLHVNGGSDNTIVKIESSDAGAGIRFTDIHASSSIEQNSNELILNSDINGADGSSTITFKVDNSEKARLDSSGRLMIGTTTTGPSTADDLTIATSGNTGISIRSGTSSAGNIFFADGTSGGDTTRGVVQYDHNSNFMRFYTDNAERVRIDSSGNLGINTTSPAAKLHVNVGTNQNFTVTSTSGVTQLQAVNDVASAFETLDIAGADIKLSPGSAERVRVASNGYFKAAHDGGFIGATSTWHEFTGTTPNGYSLKVHCDNASPLSHYISEIKFSATAPNNGNAKFLQCNDTTGAKINLDSDGGIHNYQSNDGNLCDEREKKNIVSLDTKWDKVKSWELKKFHYNEDADTDDLRYGVIAQQVEEHCPEVLTDWIKQRAEDAVLDDDGNVVTPAVPEIIRKGIKEQQMMWMAIKALQEAQARIETLEAKVATLEAG